MIKAILVGVITGFILMITGYGQTPIPKLTDDDLSGKTREELIRKIRQNEQTAAHIVSLAKETQAELDAVKVAHAQTTNELNQANVTIVQEKKDLEDYKLSVKDKVDQANAWIADKPGVMKHLHRAKWIATALVVAVCILAVLKIGGKIGLAVGAVALPALTTFIWTWL